MRFVALPIEADHGLPQAFSCDIGEGSFDFGLYANVDPPPTDPVDTLYDLARPDAPGYLVLRIVHHGAAGARVVLLRKLVPEPGLVHDAGPLAVRATAAVVARGNLNGPGTFGTRITIEVARRWA